MPTALLLAALLALPLPATREWSAYRDLCEKLHLDKFATLAADEQRKLEARLTLQPEAGEAKTVTLVIAAAAGPIVLAPEADGSTAFPLSSALRQENPKVLTTAPAGVKTKVTLGLRPRAPAGLSFRYAELLSAVPLANRLIKEEAGMLGFLAPKMKGVVLQFDKPGGQKAIIGGGGPGRTVVAAPDGRLVLPLDEALLAADPKVTLSAPPIGTDFLE